MYRLEYNMRRSIRRGLSWLSRNQNQDGSFGNIYILTTTALAIQAFENYAQEIGIDPLDIGFEYYNEINRALKYILSNAQINSNGIFFEENGNINMPTGAVLGALSSLGCKNCIVSVPGSVTASVPLSVLDGYTVGDIVNGIMNYLAFSQNNNGGWGAFYNNYDNYDISSNNNTSSYVTNGLLIATINGYTIPQSPVTNIQVSSNSNSNQKNTKLYKSTVASVSKNILKSKIIDSKKYNATNNCPAPPPNSSIYEKLQIWVYNIQNNTGGAGNYSPCEGVNIENTAIMISQMYQLGYCLEDDNLQCALQYIANNWCEPVGYLQAGWNDCQSTSYKAAYEIMLSLTLYYIKCLVTSCGTKIYWYDNVVEILLCRQNYNGSWPASRTNYDESDEVITTVWAILALEAAISKVDFY